MTDMEKKQFSGIKTEKMPLISLWLLQMLIAKKSLSKTLLELCRANGENQIINPWQFGDAFEKKTCLWLKSLPELKPTNIVEIPPRKRFDSGKSMPSWYAEAWHLPKEERAKLRSKTFPGIARAMAEQWAGPAEAVLKGGEGL